MAKKNSTGGKGGSNWAEELNENTKGAKGRRNNYRELTEEDFWGSDDGDLPF